MTKEIPLPARMDYAAMDALYAEIKEARGEELALDGSSVSHLGASGLQLLLAAHKTWENDGTHLSVTRPSARFCEHLELLGLAPDYFSQTETQE